MLDLGKGRIYRGEVLDERPDGEGTLIWPSRATFTGQWAQGIAGCETESGFTDACLKADSNTVQDLEDKARKHRGLGTSNAIAAWTNQVIDGESTHGSRPIAEEIDPVAWAERWARIMLRHARDGT